jgi:hypothetical protein
MERRCSTTELHDASAMAGFEPTTTRLRGEVTIDYTVPANFY